MNDNWTEHTVQVPRDISIENFAAMSVDTGLSIITMVYKARRKVELHTYSKQDAQTTLNVIRCAASSVNEALVYVISNSTRSEGEDDLHLSVCGAGCQLLDDSLAYGYRLTPYNRTTCFVNGLTQLIKFQPKAKLFYPPNKEALSKILPIIDNAKNMRGPEPVGLPSSTVVSTQNGGTLFPCLLAICGSGTNVIKVESDGSFSRIDSLNGALTFAGMASVLTGIHDWHTLLLMAENGSNNQKPTLPTNLQYPHQSGNDVFIMSTTDDENQDLDSKAMDSKEEMIFNSLDDLCRNLAHMLYLYAVTLNVNNICLAGELVSHRTVRKLITQAAYLKEIDYQRNIVSFHFVRMSCELGALGALLSQQTEL